MLVKYFEILSAKHYEIFFCWIFSFFVIKKKAPQARIFFDQITIVQARLYWGKTKITIVLTRRGHKNIDTKFP